MAHVKTEISRWKTSSSLSDPVIMKGKLNEDYFLLPVTCTTTNHVAIGDLVVMTANTVNEVEYCADNGVVIGIVPDTVKNRKALAVNNPGVELTKALFFNDTEEIEIAIPINPIVVSMKIEATTALEVGSPLMAGATGAATVGDDTSPNFGISLVYNTSGTGADYIAGIMMPGISLRTKT